MKARNWVTGCVLSLPLLGAAAGIDASGPAMAGGVSETDYLAEVPTVISVSRIAQSLADTPGAVTILDRDFIRMSGARDVVDLLAFVPGFQTTSSYETDAPMASYHGRSDDWATRIQVLVDGRAMHSGVLQGSAAMGWKVLALDDIERIEVLRGSNSATYGARAFLGVVNIVSRDPRDTAGVAAHVTQGDNQIADQGAQLGWSSDSASYRISADSAADAGLRGAFGTNQSRRVNLVAHLDLARGDELNLSGGTLDVDAGRGDPGDLGGNPARMRYMGSAYLQGDWHRQVDEYSDLTLTYSHTANQVRDRFLYLDPVNLPFFYGATIDFSGTEYVDRLTLQRATRHSDHLRSVVGVEYVREDDISWSAFDQINEVSSDFNRLFGSVEWRIADRWLLNAGVLGEHSGLGGDSLSPRLMLHWNWHPGHTLRVGASSAFRPPSAYEKYGRVQYYTVGGIPSGYYVYNTGNVSSEKLLSREIGYFYSPPDIRLNADLRLFSELVSDGIARSDTLIVGVVPYQAINSENFRIEGLEWQLSWSPDSATKVFANQTWTQITVDSSVDSSTRFRTEHGAPRYAASLVLMHTLDSGQQLSVLYRSADDVALLSLLGNRWLASMQRVDVRAAQPLHLGRYRGELALTLQNLGDAYQDGDRKFWFDRRAMLTLRIEH